VKTGWANFPRGGMMDCLIATSVRERVVLFLRALVRPTKYQVGTCNGEYCIWWKRSGAGK